MKIIIYRRVSSKEQARSGLGLKAQLVACMTFAEKLNPDSIEDFVDNAISGSTGIEERKGLTGALAAVKKGDVLLVANRSRIAREMLVTLTVEKILQRRGARLISVAGEGSEDVVTDLIIKTMSDLIAQVERETVKIRTKKALRVKIERGERVGAIRYGYQLAADGIHLLPSKKERDLIVKVKALRTRNLSLRAIASQLNESRVRSRNGNPWNASQIQRLLLSNVDVIKRKAAPKS